MMLKIYNASNVLEAELVVAILREHDIASRYQNAQGNIIAHEVYGFGFFGIDIFVDEMDAERAREILHLEN